LSKDAQIEYKLKEKRMADAEALKKEKGDNYNMKVSLEGTCKEDLNSMCLRVSLF